MTDKRPVVLESLGSGQGRLREMQDGEKLPLSLGGTGADNQSGARAALGLGTVATADVTVSPLDATPGRVLRVGDFGVGATDAPIITDDMDNRVTSGLFRFSASVLNPPFGYIPGTVLVIGRSATGAAASQLATGSSGGASPDNNRLAVRSKALGSWSPWAEVWTAATLVPNRLASFTLATLPSASANQWLMVYVSNLAGQPAPCFSDGTNWRRVSDNSIAN